MYACTLEICLLYLMWKTGYSGLAWSLLIVSLIGEILISIEKEKRKKRKIEFGVEIIIVAVFACFCNSIAQLF